MKDTVLYIVVPVYKDAEVIKVTCPLFLDQLFKMRDEGLISDKSRVLFVDDGSGDDSWDMIKQLTQENELYVKGICLSRNRGHQNAVTAGLLEVKDMCDVTITIDDDGQDDIGAMTQMMKEFDNGCEIVYGVRQNRDTDTFMKRFTAQTYYKTLNVLGADVIYNHADYRLVSSRALQEFANFHEVNLFLRGLFPMVGFKSTYGHYSPTADSLIWFYNNGITVIAENYDTIPDPDNSPGKGQSPGWLPPSRKLQGVSLPAV